MTTTHPPEAATSPMEATTGFFAASCLISRHMRSDAKASPPGLSTRSTTACTDLSLARERSCLMKAPAVMTLPVPPMPPSPPTMAPAMPNKLGPTSRDRSNLEMDSSDAGVICRLHQGFLQLGYAQWRRKPAAPLLWDVSV
ncbi:MAG: hypothetical protein FRX49_13187 [Trebouxia sp. A1-2]|nr:MAG: hypothetical protein FRX49_13187 [Trebouxia sp. A1-2]